MPPIADRQSQNRFGDPIVPNRLAKSALIYSGSEHRKPTESLRAVVRSGMIAALALSYDVVGAWLQLEPDLREQPLLAEGGLRFLDTEPAFLTSACSTWLAIVCRRVCRVSLQRCTGVGSRFRSADSAHLLAGPTLGWVGATHRSEIHRPATNARDEVGHDSAMGLTLNHDPLEVLIAARAHQL